jgi:hypothetical protein
VHHRCEPPMVAQGKALRVAQPAHHPQVRPGGIPTQGQAQQDGPWPKLGEFGSTREGRGWGGWGAESSGLLAKD